MPPRVDDKKDAPPPGAIAQASALTIASFYNMDELTAACAAANYGPAQNFARLLQICDSPDDKVALAAIKEFRQTRREVLEMNGLLAKKNSKITEDTGDGKKQVSQVSQTSLATFLLQENKSAPNPVTTIVHLPRETLDDSSPPAASDSPDPDDDLSALIHRDPPTPAADGAVGAGTAGGGGQEGPEEEDDEGGAGGDDPSPFGDDEFPDELH